MNLHLALCAFDVYCPSTLQIDNHVMEQLTNCFIIRALSLIPLLAPNDKLLLFLRKWSHSFHLSLAALLDLERKSLKPWNLQKWGLRKSSKQLKIHSGERTDDNEPCTTDNKSLSKFRCSYYQYRLSFQAENLIYSNKNRFKLPYYSWSSFKNRPQRWLWCTIRSDPTFVNVLGWSC